MVSNDDYDDVVKIAWHLTRDGYVRDRNSKFLHHVVIERMLGRPVRNGYLPDHKNRNPLDNRRLNLRELRANENVQNRGVFRSSKSGYKGVARQSKSTYFAYVRKDGVLIRISGFADAVEAAYVRDQIALQVHGPHVYLNFDYA